MKDYQKRGGFGGNRGGNDRSGGGRPGGGYQRRTGDDFGRPQMYPATCSKCGKSCEVPFRPDGRKPVFCRECFGIGKGGAPMDRFERPSYAGQQGAFSPANATPIPQQKDDQRLNDLKRQMDMLSSKIDRILQAVEDSARTAAAAQTKATLNAVMAKVEATTKKVAAKKNVKILSKGSSPKKKK